MTFTHYGYRAWEDVQVGDFVEVSKVAGFELAEVLRIHRIPAEQTATGESCWLAVIVRVADGNEMRFTFRDYIHTNVYYQQKGA